MEPSQNKGKNHSNQIVFRLASLIRSIFFCIRHNELNYNADPFRTETGERVGSYSNGRVPINRNRKLNL